jgi:N4-gp56 family major capsid protein
MYTALAYDYEPHVALNLRLFEDVMNASTDTDLSVEMKTYYAKRLLDNAEPNLVHDQFGDSYPIPKHGGKTIEFRKASALPKALTALSEGITPAGQSLNVTNLTATVKQYGDYIKVTDVLELTAIDPMLELSAQLLGSQAGRTLDTISREVLNGGTNKMFAPKVATGGTETAVLLRSSIDATCVLTPKLVRKAANKLKRMNADKIGDSYVAIVHPDACSDLMGHKDWLEAHLYTTPENIYNGELGKMYDIRFVESTEAKIIGPAYIFGTAANGGVCRMSLKTALDGTGSTTIAVNEEITAAQATEFNARISGGETIKLYIGGKEATISAATAGDAGSATFTASAAVKDVAANAVVCGSGAGADGSAIYCTIFLAAHAYGKTSVTGGELQYIYKPLGSGEDALNQRATTGWKVMKVTERLAEEYILRLEHSASDYAAVSVSN